MTNPEINLISIDQIIKPADQQRIDIDDGKMDELRQSIRDHGLINPITVRSIPHGTINGELVSTEKHAATSAPFKMMYELIAGSRRLKCHELLNLPTIKAIILDVDELEADILRAHENEFRHDPNPVESGIYIVRLQKKHNLSVKEIAKQLNCSEAYVRGRLDLMTYPDYILEPVACGTLSIGAAQHLNKIEPDTKRRQYVAWAVWRGITAPQASAWLQHAKLGGLTSDVDQLPNAEPRGIADAYVMNADCAVCAEKDNVTNMGMVYAHPMCITTMRGGETIHESNQERKEVPQ